MDNKLYVLIPWPLVQEYLKESWFDKEAIVAEHPNIPDGSYMIPQSRIVERRTDINKLNATPMLTSEQLDKLPAHSIINRGVFLNNDARPIILWDMVGEPYVRWIAKRGEIHDWTIYYGPGEMSYEWILQSGNKVLDNDNIHKLIPCTREALALYRK